MASDFHITKVIYETVVLMKIHPLRHGVSFLCAIKKVKTHKSRCPLTCAFVTHNLDKYISMFFIIQLLYHVICYNTAALPCNLL